MPARRDPEAVRKYHRRERGQQCDRDRALPAILAPDKQGHDVFSNRREVLARGCLAGAHVSQHQLFEGHVLGLVGGVGDRAVEADQQRGLTGRRYRLHDPVRPFDRPGVLARPDQDLVLRQQRVDVTAELDPGPCQQDEVVAHPLQVGDQVRGQQDGEAARGVRHARGQRGEEVSPCQRVERRDRLVEQQHPRQLGQRQRQRHLGALAAGQRAHALVKRNAQLRQPGPYQRGVPARVHVRPDADVILGGEPRVQRNLLGEKPDLGQERRILRGAPPRTEAVPPVGLASPASSRSSVVLPAPFGPTSADTRPSGTVTVHSVSALTPR